MPLFPKLATGAIAQYPATRTVQHRTRVIQYIDGSEQRLTRGSAPVRRWIIKLDQLTEREADEVLAFFASVRGRAGRFDFEDPWSGEIISDCRFEQDQLVVDFADVSRARVATLRIRSGGSR
jgi:hypothetical protein